MEPSMPHPALQRLEALIGAWDLEMAHPADPAITVRERTNFEWLKGGGFLIQRSEADHPDFPSGIAVIGYDEAGGECAMHQFDSRGIYRVYHVGLDDGVWKIWRDDPGFFQRFTGTFADDGTTIMALWEQSSDGVTWEKDFDGVYRKAT